MSLFDRDPYTVFPRETIAYVEVKPNAQGGDDWIGAFYPEGERFSAEFHCMVFINKEETKCLVPGQRVYLHIEMKDFPSGEPRRDKRGFPIYQGFLRT